MVEFIIAIAAGAVLAYWWLAIPHASGPDFDASRPGFMRDMSWFERLHLKEVAQDEAEFRTSEKNTVAASHEINNLKRADARQIPREALTQIVVLERTHELDIEKLETASDIKVEEERHLLHLRLQAARVALLAPHYNRKELEKHYFHYSLRRCQLEEIANRTHAEEDEFRYLNRLLPVLEEDLNERLGRPSLQANNREEPSGDDADSDRAGNHREVPADDMESVSGSKSRLGV